IDLPKQRAEVIDPWTTVPNVASAALRGELRENVDTFDLNATNRRYEALSSILSIKPLSSIDWLSLAATRLAMDQPMDDVLGSLKLSMLTGPNERYVMVEVGLFGASLWESLSPDLKRRVANDLAVERLQGWDERFLQKFWPILSGMSEQVRKEMRDALLATGLPLKEVEQRMGF